jgi:cytochrome b subunit of formate dehydrogenase
VNLHELIALHVLHVAAALVLVGYTFYAFAAGPETRKAVLIVTGVAALVMLATGVRMWQNYRFVLVGWLVVKLVCWLGLSALAGIGYRRREKAGLLACFAIIFAVTAVVMVYLKPF